MRQFLFALGLAVMLGTSSAEEKISAARPDDNMLDAMVVWGREAIKKAIVAAGGSPTRKVVRGALPEIILTRQGLRINGKPIALGQPLAEWKKVIPGQPYCDPRPSPYKIQTCVWHDLGIHLMEYRSTVFEFNIFFYFSPWNDTESVRADGSIRPAKQDWRPKHPFTGYFEMDGYGIDAYTTFEEISVSVDPERGLRCGRIDDCSVRYGAYFDGTASLSIRTTRSDAYGQLTKFSIYAAQADYSGPPPPSECIADSPEAQRTGCTPLPPASSATKRHIQ